MYFVYKHHLYSLLSSLSLIPLLFSNKPHPSVHMCVFVCVCVSAFLLLSS